MPLAFWSYFLRFFPFSCSKGIVLTLLRVSGYQNHPDFGRKRMVTHPLWAPDVHQCNNAPFRVRKALFRSNLRWMDDMAKVTNNGNKRGQKRNKTHPIQAHNKGGSPIDINYQQSTIKALKDDMKDKNDEDCHHSLPLIIMHHQSSREMTQHWRQLWCKQINTRTSPSQMTQPNDPTIKHAANSLVDVDDDRHLSSTYTVMHQTLDQDDNATRTIMMQTNQHKNRSKPNDSTIKQTFEGLVLLYQWRGSSMKEKQQ